MKRTEEILREILFQSMERKNSTLTQSYLAKTLNISLSIVNLAIGPLKRMNAIKISPRNLKVIDKRKILYYWASIRNLEKDIIYSTRVETPVRQIESEMPSDAVYTAYSGYKFMFKDIPSDYSEVYIYSDNLEEISKRFPKNSKIPNLFIIQKDKNMKQVTIAQLFVDLWNIKEWYANDFLSSMKVKLNGLLE